MESLSAIQWVLIWPFLCNDRVPSHTTEIKECGIENPTFDGLVEPFPTQAASGNVFISTMAVFTRDLVYMNSTFDFPMELPTTPNDPVGNPIVILPKDPLPASDSNIHLLALETVFPVITPCISNKPLPSPGILVISMNFMGYNYGK